MLNPGPLAYRANGRIQFGSTCCKIIYQLDHNLKCKRQARFHFSIPEIRLVKKVLSMKYCTKLYRILQEHCEETMNSKG